MKVNLNRNYDNRIEGYDSLYVVCIEDVCDSFQGAYTTLEEAKKAADEEFSRSKKHPVDVDLVIWDDESESYVQKEDSLEYIAE